MKVYRLEKGITKRTEKTWLKRAAGGEDIVTLSDEALKRFKNGNRGASRVTDPVKLALEHINDASPVLDELANDAEFIAAERLALLAELCIRVAPSSNGKKIYERVSLFVAEQLSELR